MAGRATVQMMLDPAKYGLTQCPRCNGYGSSLKEKADACSRCGGTGLIPESKRLDVDLSHEQ